MSATAHDLNINWSKAVVTPQNPCGIYGVDFIEYSGSDATYFEGLFKQLGFTELAQVSGKQIKLFRQGDINFILNTEKGTFARLFSDVHGPCISSTGFRVHDAELAFKTAISRGARAYDGNATARGATPFFAVYGIGDSLVYFVDQKSHQSLYSGTFGLKDINVRPVGHGLRIVDHFTNNVPVGEMQKWCDFYEKVFNFREARYFDIRGKATGLISKVMRSPCSQFSIPINEPTDKKSQIQEYLEEYKGSGIQHLAMTTNDIVPTLEVIKKNGVQFLQPPPNTYYKALKDRLPGVSEDLQRLEKNAILVDGDHDGYLLQIFSKNVIGPIFYEVIQRKGHEGFGEGNFQALFDAIEADQRARGYL